MINQHITVMAPDDLSAFKEDGQIVVALYDGKESTTKVKLSHALSYRLFLQLKNFDKLTDIDEVGS